MKRTNIFLIPVYLKTIGVRRRLPLSYLAARCGAPVPFPVLKAGTGNAVIKAVDALRIAAPDLFYEGRLLPHKARKVRV